MPKRLPASKKAADARLVARPAGRATTTLPALLKRTREQLEDAARRLGLSGLGRLKREDLARRVHRALHGGASARPAMAIRAGKAPASPAPAARKAPASARGAAVAKARVVKGRPARKRAEPEPETGARSKFDLGSRIVEPPAEHIPWGYGQDRITALPIDPRRLYAYWEVRDDSIAAARQALGKGGRDAWLNLRVYDITGRIFDGTNAHSDFDQKVDRDTRQWFFDIGKPTSTHCVEVGMKSFEGYFVKIARSGRVDFPRAQPWAGGAGPVEWLSVHEATGDVGSPVSGVPAAPPADSDAAGGLVGSPAAHGGAHAPGAWAEGEYWVVSDTPAFREWALQSGWESHDFLKTEWIGAHGRMEWFATGQRFEWVGPVVKTGWEAGPFPVPVEAPGIVEERHEGPVLVQKIGDRTRVVYGPWQVVIRGVSGRAEGRVLARWEVRKSWVSDVGFEVEGGSVRWRALHPQEGARPGSSEAMLAGASERRWLIGSELRLAGASELFRVGASEFRYLGASETLFAGASETRLLGGSEKRLLGASERLLGGASERVHAGASERVTGGASETLPRAAGSRYPTKDSASSKR